MRHGRKNAIQENMYGLLESLFEEYTKQLRSKYPERTIRNGAVLASGIPEFARLDYIELVDARTGIPDGLPSGLIRTIKRAKHQPIWIPGPNFPDDPLDMFEQMQPLVHADEIIWQHSLRKRRSTWRDNKS
jgi:hypothetical protein